MNRLLADSSVGASEILIGASLERIKDEIDLTRSVVITDKTIRRLHGRLFSNVPVIEMGSGEDAKNLKTAENIYRRLLEMGVDRSTCVWGIGGGIVCDVTGFVASTFMRGLRFGFVPTTLLAQIDAGIGGKNGVNLDGYKNIVGTFRQPQRVLINFDLLQTLPGREVLCGLSEIVKAALIKSSSLFNFLENEWPALRSLEGWAIAQAVLAAIRIKTAVVRKDAEESRERKKLNFGHTLGHAIEKTTGVSHGAAVAEGMAFAVGLSVTKGLLAEKDAGRISRMLKKLRSLSRTRLSPEILIEAIHKDKKRRGQDIDVILLEKIGKARIVTMSFHELEKFIHDLRQHR